MTVRLHRGDLPDLSRFSREVAIDTETMGLEPHRDRLCVVQLSAGDGSADVVQIPQDATGGARDGQLVVVELTQAPDTRRPPIGKVIAVLGDSLTPSLVVEAAIHGHNLPHEFPQEVLDEAASVPLVVEPAMVGNRVDLRAMPLVTIDGADAKDFDDAVYCESNRQGLRMKNRSGYRLVVAIGLADSSVKMLYVQAWACWLRLRA